MQEIPTPHWLHLDAQFPVGDGDEVVLVVVAVEVVLAVVEVVLLEVVDVAVVVPPDPEPAKADCRMGMYALYAAPFVGSRPYM